MRNVIPGWSLVSLEIGDRPGHPKDAIGPPQVARLALNIVE
jgi:hypothetical protein